MEPPARTTIRYDNEDMSDHLSKEQSWFSRNKGRLMFLAGAIILLCLFLVFIRIGWNIPALALFIAMLVLFRLSLGGGFQGSFYNKW